MIQWAYKVYRLYSIQCTFGEMSSIMFRDIFLINTLLRNTFYVYMELLDTLATWTYARGLKVCFGQYRIIDYRKQFFLIKSYNFVHQPNFYINYRGILLCSYYYCILGVSLRCLWTVCPWFFFLEFTSLPLTFFRLNKFHKSFLGTQLYIFII